MAVCLYVCVCVLYMYVCVSVYLYVCMCLVYVCECMCVSVFSGSRVERRVLRRSVCGDVFGGLDGGDVSRELY